jgi:hypothetical protein
MNINIPDEEIRKMIQASINSRVGEIDFPGLYKQGVEEFLAQRNKNPPLVDCVSFKVPCGMKNTFEILHDKEFFNKIGAPYEFSVEGASVGSCAGIIYFSQPVSPMQLFRDIKYYPPKLERNKLGLRSIILDRDALQNHDLYPQNRRAIMDFVDKNRPNMQGVKFYHDSDYNFEVTLDLFETEFKKEG